MKTIYTCPDCGADITPIVDKAMRDQRSAAGKAKTAKKTAAQRNNMEKLNAAYTPEKRRLAAEKRRATMAAKKAAKLGIILFAAAAVAPLPVPAPLPDDPFIREQRDAYGPGVGSDQYGRPTEHKTPAPPPADPFVPVLPDALGPGVGMDATGQPTTVQPKQ